MFTATRTLPLVREDLALADALVAEAIPDTGAELRAPVVGCLLLIVQINTRNCP